MIFEKNITALKQIDRKLAEAIMKQNGADGLELVVTKNGKPSIRVHTTTLHSLYDPVKEAREWTQYYAEEIENADEIILFGFGLGYHVIELCDITEKHITVYEPRTDILKKAFETIDFTSIIPRITLITDSRVQPVEDCYAVLRHNPSVSINQSYFNDIYAELRRLRDVPGDLRILVVGPIYGGSLPVARYCSSSLIKMGHTVELLDNSRFDNALFFAKDITANRQRYNRMMNHLSSFVSEAVLARCEVFKPHIVFALAQSPLTPECLEVLRQHNVTTAYWFVEDFRFMDYWRNIARYYDFFFTIQRGIFFTEMEKAGLNNYYYLPMAACPDVHKPMNLSADEKSYFGSDVSFVGAGYYNRRHFMKGLLDYDLKIWGTDWDMNSALARCIQRAGARIDTDDVVKIFNATSININLHSSTYHRGINPFGDFVNPRTFEIISCGGFQLTDRRSGIEGLFETGEELIVFEDLNDLRNKIEYYLENRDEREEIIRKGRERVLRDHTYEKRMSEMLGIVSGKSSCRPCWREEGEDVGKLVEAAGSDTELGIFLSRFSERKRITLSDIHKEISKGEGEISKTEALLLVMHEFVR